MTIQIVTPGRFVEARDALILPYGLEGWFTLRAVKNGAVVRERKFKNLILNNGLDRFGSIASSDLIFMFRVGVGTDAPTPEQVQLSSEVGAFRVITSQAEKLPGQAPDYFSRLVIVGASAIGALGNANLTEIGVGGPQSNQLFSRALIVDSSGNPVAFPIASDEQLQVSYELRLYPPLEDETHTVDIGGARTCTVRAIGISDASMWGASHPNAGYANASGNGASFYDGGLGSITAQKPQGAYIDPSIGSPSVSAYSAGTYKRTTRFSWGPSSANSSNLRTNMVIFRCGAFQFQYDPPLQKTNTQTMFIDYEIAWGRR